MPLSRADCLEIMVTLTACQTIGFSLPFILRCRDIVSPGRHSKRFLFNPPNEYKHSTFLIQIPLNEFLGLHLYNGLLFVCLITLLCVAAPHTSKVPIVHTTVEYSITVFVRCCYYFMCCQPHRTHAWVKQHNRKPCFVWVVGQRCKLYPL